MIVCPSFLAHVSLDDPPWKQHELGASVRLAIRSKDRALGFNNDSLDQFRI